MRKYMLTNVKLIFQDFKWIFPIVPLLLMSLAACNIAREHEALNKVRMAAKEIPNIAGLDLISSYDMAWSFSAEGSTCSYGRSYLFYGSNLSSLDALDLLTQGVEENSWSQVIRESPSA